MVFINNRLTLGASFWSTAVDENQMPDLQRNRLPSAHLEELLRARVSETDSRENVLGTSRSIHHAFLILHSIRTQRGARR